MQAMAVTDQTNTTLLQISKRVHRPINIAAMIGESSLNTRKVEP